MAARQSTTKTAATKAPAKKAVAAKAPAKKAVAAKAPAKKAVAAKAPAKKAVPANPPAREAATLAPPAPAVESAPVTAAVVGPTPGNPLAARRTLKLVRKLSDPGVVAAARVSSQGAFGRAAASGRGIEGLVIGAIARGVQRQRDSRRDPAGLRIPLPINGLLVLTTSEIRVHQLDRNQRLVRGGTTVRVPLDDIVSSELTSLRTVDVLDATLVTGEVLHVTTQRRGLLRKTFATNGAVFAHLQQLLPHG